MWCPAGYLTVGEIVEAMSVGVFDVLTTAHNRVPPEPWEYPDDEEDWPTEREVTAYFNWLTIALLDACADHVRAATGSGNVVRLSRSMLGWSLVHKHAMRSGASFDAAMEGWKGGPFPDDYFLRLDLADLQFTYLSRVGLYLIVSQEDSMLAPISGAPLCIREIDLPAPIASLRDWLSTNAWNGRSAEAGRNVPPAQAIVDAYHAGRFTTKAEAYSLFAKGMKHAVWAALWREAVGIEGKLKRPGPKPG